MTPKPVGLAHELVRLALVARLATQLADPALARRAARDAVPIVRLLAGLDDGEHAARDNGELPELDELLDRLRRRDADDELDGERAGVGVVPSRPSRDSDVGEHGQRVDRFS